MNDSDFGGLSNAARFWKEALSRASEAGNHTTVLNGFASLAKLMNTYEQLREKPHELSDAELAERLDIHVASLCERHPSLVLRAAEKMGVIVTLPEPAKHELTDDQ